MSSRVLSLLVCLALAVSPAAVLAGPADAAQQASAGPQGVELRLTRPFSPNGDGVRDRARIRFDLPEATRVSVGVRNLAGKQVRLARLGRMRAGSHVWTWDGRRADGRRLPHGFYYLHVRTPLGGDRGSVDLDLRFQASVDVVERYGRARSKVVPVFPRTRVVRDSVGLVSFGEDDRARLLLRAPDGSVVVRRNLAKNPTGQVVDGWWRNDPEVWEARDDKGRPLRPGLYKATVKGVDRVGNRGTSRPVVLRVSGRALQWVEDVRTLSATESRFPMCTWATKDCGTEQDCGTVEPAQQRPGALTHRAGWCPDSSEWQTIPVAKSAHYVPVAAAVRGIDAVRLAFSGAPTVAGESDPGTLRYANVDVEGGSELSSSSGAQTAWFTPGSMSRGRSRDPMYGTPRALPGAYWGFQTTGTDTFDVATFTVEMRYLAVPD